VGATAAGIIGGVAAGALVGGGIAAVTGGSVGQGMLYGGLTGGVASGIGAAMSSMAPAASAGASSVSDMASALQTASPGLSAADATAAAEAYSSAGYTVAQINTAAAVDAVQGQVAAGAISQADATAVQNAITAQAAAPAGTPFDWSNIPQSAMNFLNAPTGAALLRTGTSALTGAAALSQVKANQVNPSQYVVDPTTGRVVASSVVGANGATTSLGTATPALNTAATTGLSTVANQQAGLFSAAGANQGQYVQSVVDPLRQQQSAGYGALLQSNAQRGLAGSSLGDQSVTNYLTDSGRAIADTTAAATQQSLGLQSGISSNQATTAVQQAGLGTTIADQNLAAMNKGQVAQQAGAANATQLNTATGNMITGVSNALGGPNGLSTPPMPSYPNPNGGQWQYNSSTGQWQ